MEIINQSVYLKYVEVVPENGLLLKFDNLPIWKNNRFNIYLQNAIMIITNAFLFILRKMCSIII